MKNLTPRDMVYAMVVKNPDGTTSHWEPGYEQVSSFYSRFWQQNYTKIGKNTHFCSEDVLF